MMSGATPPASDVSALASRSENGMTVSLTVMPVFSFTSPQSCSQVSSGPHLSSQTSRVDAWKLATYAGARVGLARALPPMLTAARGPPAAAGDRRDWGPGGGRGAG